MRRNPLLVGVTAVALVGPVAVAIPTSMAATPTVVAVSASHRPGVDRVVFRLDAGLPTSRTVRYVANVAAVASGAPVRVLGRYFLLLRMAPATARNATGPVSVGTLTPLLPNVRQVVRIGDRDGVLTYALGLAQQVPPRLYTLGSPARVVVDVPVLSWPVLRYSTHGPNVRAAQHLLRARGYRLAADGGFGGITAAAVRGFQRSRGLQVDGVIGPRTWSALVPVIRDGTRGAAVRALQVELRKSGAAVTVDGVFGAQTLAAVERVQAHNSLPVDGVAGAMTWMTLACRDNNPRLVFRRSTIGYSVRGRPIRAVEMGNPWAVRLLVVAATHGDETAGVAIARALEAKPRPANVDLWLIEAVNPDGVAARTHQNAHGVNLNRNFPYRWIREFKPWAWQYTGPYAASEPETRAVVAFVNRVRPLATVWYHQQPRPLVDESGGASIAIERRYATLVGLPLVRLIRYRGSGIGWENHTLPGTTGFAVEIATGTPSATTVQRHARAVLALLG